MILGHVTNNLEYSFFIFDLLSKREDDSIIKDRIVEI